MHATAVTGVPAAYNITSHAPVEGNCTHDHNYKTQPCSRTDKHTYAWLAFVL